MPGIELRNGASTPISAPPNTSWSIGEAMPMMPIPAVTFMQSTDQISQNCGVFSALSTWTCRVLIMLLAAGAGGVQPLGFQPDAGTLMVKAPAVMNTK